MAIIKCPECGHDVSSEAPVCPHCGVKIAAAPAEENPRKKYVIISAVVAAVLAVGAGIAFYVYHSGNAESEQEAYEYALTSQDMAVLESYLSTYTGADAAHRDSIESHLSLLREMESAWHDATVGGTTAALEAFMARYPSSIHAREVEQMTDSIDWQRAQREATPEAYRAYLDRHASGLHADEASEMIGRAADSKVTDEEDLWITALISRFFSSISTQADSEMRSTVAPVMSEFLGKKNATPADAVTFMHKMHKKDAKSTHWEMTDNMVIDKHYVQGEDALQSGYEYKVTVSLHEDTEYADESRDESVSYAIVAVISPEHRISALSMKRE